MPYLLDLDKLQPADIVLETGTKPHSRLIMAFTRGSYSHALLYANLSLIEATLGGGVFSKNPQRLLVHQASHLGVYRMRNRLTPSDETAILTAAGLKIGSLYSADEAVKVIMRIRTNPSTSGQFCSRLVAQCYATAGISLVDNPDYCSPHDLANSCLLVPVQDAVRPALDVDLELARTLDINLRDQKATMRWLKDVRRLAARENETIVAAPDVLQFLLRYPEYDADAMICIRKTPYLELLHHDRSVSPHRYDVGLFLAWLIHNRLHADDILQRETAKELPLIERYGSNLRAYHQYANTRLSFVQAHIELYDRLLAMTEERLNVILEALQQLRMQSVPQATQVADLLTRVRALRI